MDRTIKFLFLFLFVTTLSCTSTIEVERKIQTATGIGKQVDPSEAVIAVPIEMEEPDPIIIEKPIYIPQGTPVASAPNGRSAVQASNEAGIMAPQDYANAAMLYDYDRDFVYELYCRPFRVSDVTLQPGEKTSEVPFISDSERWMLGAGVSYENGIAVQHIYVKPTAANLTASLIINTDQRVYHLILRSFDNIHMPIVRWRYHDKAMPQNYIPVRDSSPTGSVDSPAIPGTKEGDSAADETSLFADPRFLSFNYRITYGFFKKPRWLPELAYDDGKKTYITFPDQVLQMELPAVFEDRDNIINFRVHENIMILDKLIEKVTIKLQDKIVTVEKRKGE